MLDGTGSKIFSPRYDLPTILAILWGKVKSTAGVKFVTKFLSKAP